MRLSQGVLFVLLIIVGFGVYTIADQYQVVEKKINRLKIKGEHEREAIRVLRAEWAFLTNPDRMEKIAQEYFQLQPLTEKQMAMASSIPMRAFLDEQLLKPEQETMIVQKDTVPMHTATAEHQKPKAVIAPAMPKLEALPPVQPVSMIGGM